MKKKQKSPGAVAIAEPAVVESAPEVIEASAEIVDDAQVEEQPATKYESLTVMQMLALIDGFVKKQIASFAIQFSPEEGFVATYLYGTHPYSPDVLREMVRLTTTAAAYFQTGRLREFELSILDGQLPRYAMRVTSQ